MCYVISLQYCVRRVNRKHTLRGHISVCRNSLFTESSLQCSEYSVLTTAVYCFKFISKQCSLPNFILSTAINKRTAVKIKSFRQDCNFHRLYFCRLRRNFWKTSSLYFMDLRTWQVYNVYLRNPIFYI